MTHKEKLSIQWPCNSNFHHFAQALFVVNTPTVFLSYYYIEWELFAVFLKILFENWRRFCHPSVIQGPVKCFWGGGIWSPEWTLQWGLWTAFWLGWWGGGCFFNDNFQKSQMPGGVAWLIGITKLDSCDAVPVNWYKCNITDKNSSIQWWMFSSHMYLIVCRNGQDRLR